MMHIHDRRVLGFLLVLCLSWWTVRPLVGDHYFPIHDDTQVGRVVVMGKAIRWGQFPVRWVSDLGYGYGYPIFNFYGPLPYYTGGLLYALGMNGLVATKIMMGIGMVGSGLAMFLLLRGVLGFIPAVVASVFYMYAPYHAVQLYVRGAVGEMWTLVFFPFIFYGLLYPKKYLVGSIGLAGVILSHTLLGYATAVMLILGLFVSRHHMFLIAMGLAISAFFWLPAVFEMKSTNVAGQISSTADFHDHFVCMNQLWSSPWGFGGSTKDCLDGLSFMVGKIHIVLAAIGTMLLMLNNIFRKIARYGLVFAVLGFILLLPISTKVWEIIPFFAYIQYPWRFLVFVIFGSSILAGTAVSSIRNRRIRLFVAGILIVGIIICYGKRFNPQFLITKNMKDYESTTELRYRVSRISDEYMPLNFIRPVHEQDVVHDTIIPTEGLIIAKTVETDIYSRFDLESQKELSLTVNKAYFPGLEFLVNGKIQEAVVTYGIPRITIPKGRSVVEIRLTNTPVRMIGNLVSVCAVLGIFIYYGKKINT